MDDKLMLMIPGPTPVPEQVLLALSKHPIGHRSGEFSKIMAEVTANLKWLHQTENDVLLLTVSGTGAMEAGIINFLSPAIAFWLVVMVSLVNAGLRCVRRLL